MKKKDIIKFSNGLPLLNELKGSLKLVRAISRNKILIADELEELQSVQEAVKDTVKELTQKEVELIKEHAKKDEEGNPVPRGVGFALEDPVKYAEANNALKEEYSDDIEEFEKKQKEFEEMLEEESDVELKKVAEKELPKQLSVAQMDVLIYMLEDD